MSERKISHRVSIAVLSLGLALALAAPARAGQVRLTLANDFLTNNRLSDDLYTSSIDLRYTIGRYDLAFVEHAFTDSQNGLRFDESYLTVGRTLAPVAGWHPHVQVGVLRVGNGLFGERAQNAVHDLLGNQKVHLPYIDGTRLYPTVEVQVQREFHLRRTLSVVPKVEAESSVGFKQGAALSAQVVWRPISAFWFGAELGGRYTDTDFAPLQPWIARTGLTWEVSAGLPLNLVFAWSHNRYGTETQHVSLGYRFQLGEGRGPRPPTR